MKRIIGLLVLFICFSSLATDVQWGPGEHYDYRYSDVPNGWGYIMFFPEPSTKYCIDLFVRSDIGPNGGWLLEFEGGNYGHSMRERFIPANEGDVVSVDSMLALRNDECLIHHRMGDDVRNAGYRQVTVNGGLWNYLAFLVVDDAFPGQGDDYVVGWLMYMIEEDGRFRAYWSAWDLDGGPMIVGGFSALIPEPSSGLLLILGSALLFLRRRAVE